MFYVKPGYVLGIAGLFMLTGCSHTVSRGDRQRLDDLLSKAELFFETGEIDSSLHYVDLCFDIDRDYPPAHHLKGRIYLYKDGIYNRKLSASALRQAVKLESENAEYHYSLGLTLERQGYFYNALHEFEQSAEFDSTDPRPLNRIAEINERIGLRYDDRGRFERALEAASAAASLSNDPVHYYMQAAALYQMRDYESSSGILLEALKAGGESSVTVDCLLLLGADLVLTGHYDSAYVVFEKARLGMSQERRDIMDDVRYLMPPLEYASYKEASFYKQEKMQTQFWGQLDPDPTTGINERKLEHYARFVHAQLTFSLPDRSVEGWRTKRGEMYIRYGRPSSMNYVLGSSGDSADPPKWIWKYNDFGQPVTLVFEDTFLNGDFDFPFPNKSWTAADFDKDPARIADMLQDVIPQTFAYSPGSGPLEYYYMPRQFKASRGRTALEIFVAVPYDHLEFRRQGANALATLEWRQILRFGNWRAADSAEVLRLYEIRASQIDNPNLSVADRLSLEAYPDSLAFSISIRDTLSDHIGIDSRSIRLRDFYTGRVEISDIVLARRIDTPPGELRFERDELRILSNLDNRYFTAEPVWLYFEIYNLAKGADDRTSYTIKQRVTQKRSGGLLASLRSALSGKDLQEIETSYTGGSIYTEENRILMVQLSDLEPGPYTISIEVIDDVSGMSTSGSEDIVLYE
jgi:GWxTD domain-containing protein